MIFEKAYWHILVSARILIRIYFPRVQNGMRERARETERQRGRGRDRERIIL